MRQGKAEEMGHPELPLTDLSPCPPAPDCHCQPPAPPHRLVGCRSFTPVTPRDIRQSPFVQASQATSSCGEKDDKYPHKTESQKEKGEARLYCYKEPQTGSRLVMKSIKHYICKPWLERLPSPGFPQMVGNLNYSGGLFYMDYRVVL